MVEFDKIGRLPSPGDNCAIATRRLAAGTIVHHDDGLFALSHTVLEGHRFAVKPIPTGEYLLSWGMPFGRAAADIQPGQYVCNEGVLQALQLRRLDFALPTTPNFVDEIPPFVFDATQFQAAKPTMSSTYSRPFQGYRRSGKRGVGTRNDIVLLGLNSLVAGFVQQFEKEVKQLAAHYENIDDIVAVTHTEGSHAGSNNQELLLRTLVGYMVHPNTGAVLVLDAGDVGVTNAMLLRYAREHDYPLDDVLHQFMSLRGSFGEDMAQATAIITGWLPQVNYARRTSQPLSELRIALQCGGSDAFSGISGNPVVARVAREVIAAGGAANLAETDELVGAESYMVQQVRNADVAESFLHMVDRFSTWAGLHGHSVDGNPSGGNIYRGLYNIYLKSLGAAAKRHPAVRLDHVIEYSVPMREPGFYFMDSPGNDLESIAGQVATGCNLIFFVTGNGSITNFPFVPTIKVVTTSERYAQLSQEMDVNAGAYLDGTPLRELGQRTLELAIDVASGQRSVGEKAGHAQVQIWREWRLTPRMDPMSIAGQSRPGGRPVPIRPPHHIPGATYSAWRTAKGVVSDQVGLILPASLCSGQIARIAADRLNGLGISRKGLLSHFVTLVHTEGCGASMQAEFVDTLLGYMMHPLVGQCLLLEHGCETTHNDFWRWQVSRIGIDPQRFGWASVQGDGGIDKSLANIETWFREKLAQAQPSQPIQAGLDAVRLGLVTTGACDPNAAVTLARLAKIIVAAGGTVVMAAHDVLLTQPEFWGELSEEKSISPTLAYAQRVTSPGFHIMAALSAQWTETCTGLGATGVELILAALNDRPQQGHPLVPLVQIGMNTDILKDHEADLDMILHGSGRDSINSLLKLLLRTLAGAYTPRATQQVNVGFQITRGLQGISL